MKKEKQLTVVTVVFNAERELEETFKSIFSQTYFSLIEFIVIDGNSTDNTKKIIDEYSDKIDIYISENDNGVYDAMNKAIELSNSSWINFMNAGDIFYDKFVVEKAIKGFDIKSDLIYGNVHIFDENIDRVVKADLENKILKETPFCHQSLFVKTSLIKEKKFNLFYSVLADYDFMLSSYLDNKVFQYLDFTVSKYRLGGMSQNNIQLMYVEGVKILLDAKKRNKNILLEESPFYRGLQSSIGDENSQPINNAIIDLASTSFTRQPFSKIKKYKNLLRVFYGVKTQDSVNVVHLNTFDTVGGAARAVFRLSEALNKYKYSSLLLSLFKYGSSKKVISISKNRLLDFISKISRRIILSKYNLMELDPHKPFSVNNLGYKLSKNSILKKSNIIHLHWINYNFISIKEFEKIVALKKPIVWTMHDMWAFTGGCHNPIACDRFTEECGMCPVLESNEKQDISTKILQQKESIFRNANVTIVAPSIWMKKQVEKSAIFKNKKVFIIPNAININFFTKVSFERSKEYFSFINKNKTYVSFGTHSNANYKGLSYLIDALNLLAKEIDVSGIELIVFGDNSKGTLENLSDIFVYHNVGKTNDDIKLRALYGISDIFISPSLQESFGQVLTESMACETACIAFDYSGSKDIIEHKKNGYLAQYLSAEDIKNGLVYLLENKETLIDIQKNARLKVINYFDYEVVAKEHIKLYNSILKNT